MNYTTPPPMSASTLLGATQLNIVADDIVDIEGRCKAPNIPFETVTFGDELSGANQREAQYNMIHKYITSASEHLGLEYSITVAGGAGTGASQVSTCMIVAGTNACTFTDSVGSTVYRGVKDLSFLADSDGVNRAVQFKANDATNGATNETTIYYLGQIKTTSSGYTPFSASRFRDGDTTSACTDLHALRDNIINLNGLAKRGTAGFRARSRDVYVAEGVDANQTLFDGYVKSTRGGRLYLLVGYSREHGYQSTIYFKPTFNGTALTTIAMAGSGSVAPEKMTMTACSLDTTGIAHNPNDEVRVTVTACSTHNLSYGYDVAYLLYLAEAPGGSNTGYTTLGPFTAGSYVYGNSGSTSLQLSTAASNIEYLAGDTDRKGYGSTGSSSGSMPVGDARAVYRFPIHRAGRQIIGGESYPIERMGMSVSAGSNSRDVQRLYAIHTGDTGYYRAYGATLKYAAASASPNTYEIQDFSTTSRYDSINMLSMPDLAMGMIYYTEVEIPKGYEGTDGYMVNDYIEERYS